MCLYEKGDGDCLIETIPMMLDVKGTWYTKVDRDLNGIYYTYKVKFQNVENEVVDVYAKTAGVKTVLVPEKNMRDVSEIAAEITKGLEIIPVTYMDEVLKIALVQEGKEDEN